MIEAREKMEEQGKICKNVTHFATEQIRGRNEERWLKDCLPCTRQLCNQKTAKCELDQLPLSEPTCDDFRGATTSRDLEKLCRYYRRECPMELLWTRTCTNIAQFACKRQMNSCGQRFGDNVDHSMGVFFDEATNWFRNDFHDFFGHHVPDFFENHFVKFFRDDIPNFASEDLEDFFDEVVESAPANNIRDFFLNTMPTFMDDDMSEFLNETIDHAGDVFMEVKIFFKDNFTSFFEAEFKKTFENGTVIHIVKNATNSILGDMESKVEEAMTEANKMMHELIDKVESSVTGLFGRIKNRFSRESPTGEFPPFEKWFSHQRKKRSLPQLDLETNIPNREETRAYLVANDKYAAEKIRKMPDSKFREAYNKAYEWTVKIERLSDRRRQRNIAWFGARGRLKRSAIHPRIYSAPEITQIPQQEPECHLVENEATRDVACLFYMKYCPCEKEIISVSINHYCPELVKAQDAYKNVTHENKWVTYLNPNKLQVSFNKIDVNRMRELRNNIYPATFDVTVGDTPIQYAAEFGVTENSFKETSEAILLGALEALKRSIKTRW